MNASSNVIRDAISAPQIRAGRAIIGWTQERLAVESGLPKRTIARIELEEGMPRSSTLDAIRSALEAGGVEFTNGDAPGVRSRIARNASIEREAAKQQRDHELGVCELPRASAQNIPSAPVPDATSIRVKSDGN